MQNLPLNKKTNWLVRAALINVIALLVACAPAADINTQGSSTSSLNKALEITSPEEAGMDSSRLNSITKAMQEYVDDGLLAGVVTMAARDNKLVHFESVGYRDLESQSPMTNDALFRIYSMTKPDHWRGINDVVRRRQVPFSRSS
jgi:CubicO group peptidase (beta-lactamase class C family)